MTSEARSELINQLINGQLTILNDGSLTYTLFT